MPGHVFRTVALLLAGLLAVLLVEASIVLSGIFFPDYLSVPLRVRDFRDKVLQAEYLGLNVVFVTSVSFPFGRGSAEISLDLERGNASLGGVKALLVAGPQAYTCRIPCTLELSIKDPFIFIDVYLFVTDDYSYEELPENLVLELRVTSKARSRDGG